MRVWSLDREAPREEEMATHSNILAWKISWTEVPGGLQSIGRRKWQPIQYSCLENLMDRGAWWTVVHRVTKSQIGLKQLSVCTHLCVRALACAPTEHYSAIKDNEIMPFAATLDGPRDCHTEWRQTQKDKNHMTSLICEILKWVQMNWSTKQK